MIPPAIGDVTGIQPITNRTVVYVVQNGKLQIYDTTTDKLQSTQVDIIGQAVDVKWWIECSRRSPVVSRQESGFGSGRERSPKTETRDLTPESLVS